MKLSFSAADEAFREEIASWLAANLRDEFAAIRFRGGPGDEHVFIQERIAWEQRGRNGAHYGDGKLQEYLGCRRLET